VLDGAGRVRWAQRLGFSLAGSYRLAGRNAYFVCAILWLMGIWVGRLVRLLVLLILAAAVLWAADWAVMRVRVSHGTAYGVVQVNQFLATPLKGSKVEYDYMGSVPVACSRSIYPQQGNSACWWLERHKTQWE
jgi:hypothetical protein